MLFVYLPYRIQIKFYLILSYLILSYLILGVKLSRIRNTQFFFMPLLYLARLSNKVIIFGSVYLDASNDCELLYNNDSPGNCDLIPDSLSS